jgi:SAM-dependent methyltransferase
MGQGDVGGDGERVIRAPREGRDFLEEYVRVASLALSLVRGVESELFAREELVRPVLDVGCGDGLFASLTYRRQLDVGVDVSLREVRRARRRGAYGNVEHASVTRIPAADGAFNTVISNCVFEHIAPLQEAFAEIHRVLAPGGRYLFTAHSHLYEDYLYYPRLLRRLGAGSLGTAYCRFIRRLFRHFNCFAPDQWTRLLEEAGFTRVTAKYYLARDTEEAFDRLLALSSVAYVNKALFSRWVIGPRRLVWRLCRNRMRRLHHPDCDLGGALFLIAHKD